MIKYGNYLFWQLTHFFKSSLTLNLGQSCTPGSLFVVIELNLNFCCLLCNPSLSDKEINFIIFSTAVSSKTHSDSEWKQGELVRSITYIAVKILLRPLSCPFVANFDKFLEPPF